MASYIHAGVFVPLFNYFEGCEQVSFCPAGNTSTRLQYWDENAYVSELVLSMPENDIPTKGDSRKSAADIAAAAAEKEGLVAQGEEAETKAKKRKAEAKDSSKQKKVTYSQVHAMQVSNFCRPLPHISNSGATVMQSFIGPTMQRRQTEAMEAARTPKTQIAPREAKKATKLSPNPLQTPIATAATYVRASSNRPPKSINTSV